MLCVANCTGVDLDSSFMSCFLPTDSLPKLCFKSKVAAQRKSKMKSAF